MTDQLDKAIRESIQKGYENWNSYGWCDRPVCRENPVLCEHDKEALFDDIAERIARDFCITEHQFTDWWYFHSEMQDYTKRDNPKCHNCGIDKPEEK